MKYLRKFNEGSIEEKSIRDWCKKFNIFNFDIVDGFVNVDGDVYISGKKLTKIPIQFGIVSRYFHCEDNKLTSLEGSPKQVNISFFCTDNRLKSLEGSPVKILEGFFCYRNELITLKGGPSSVGGTYWCQKNKLITLEGGPDKIDSNFDCSGNPIYEIYKLFEKYDKYKTSIDDYKYLRGTDIIRIRFNRACEDAEIEMPESIRGYKFI
jgi:hypothetical protein